MLAPQEGSGCFIDYLRASQGRSWDSDGLRHDREHSITSHRSEVKGLGDYAVSMLANEVVATEPCLAARSHQVLEKAIRD